MDADETWDIDYQRSPRFEDAMTLTNAVLEVEEMLQYVEQKHGVDASS